MQDFPLTLQHVHGRAERLFARKEIVSKTATGLHRTTWGEVAGRARRAAAALARLGVKNGDRVATLAWNHSRHLELYLAIPCMGAVLHTLNVRLSPDQLAHVINDAEDVAIVVDDSLLPLVERIRGRIPSVQHVIVMRDFGANGENTESVSDYETLLAAESGFAWPTLDERDAAAMCYTSGTTGNPKGVLSTHRSLFLHSMATLMKGAMNIDEGDAVLPMVPMFHANAWGLPYAAAMVGAKFIFPGRWMGDPDAVIDLAATERATVLAGVPTIWFGVLQKLGERLLPDVHTIICGGAAVPKALIEQMDARGLRLVQAWGMTETSPMATISLPRSWHQPEKHLDIRAMQGPPVAGVELRICDIVTGDELPWDGEAFGEIHVRGPWICSGYFHNVDPERMSADGWFRTGDVATLSPDGFVQIVDRTKDVIKSGGEWISSVALENAIISHPKVLEAAVIGVPHPKWSERPVGYVVPRPEFRNDLTSAEILTFLESRFEKFWLPDEIRFIDEVPKTSVGKFDKKVLRAGAAPLSG
jgi:fatty-acyl-CoA synthase